MKDTVSHSFGKPFPLGESLTDRSNSTWNFAIFSQRTLSHFIIQDRDRSMPPLLFPLSSLHHRSHDIWHIEIIYRASHFLWCWGYEENGSIYSLQDPYAKLLDTGNIWNNNSWKNTISSIYPLAMTFDWDLFYRESCHHQYKKDNRPLIIYEMHVRGYTRDKSSKISRDTGTFKGALSKIQHLKNLGITTIELLPIFEFDESEWMRFNPGSKKELSNYWGYSPLSFFSPHGRYFSQSNPSSWPYEFRDFVQACHVNGIQVILDVVFNHTGEGNIEGPSYSWKTLAKEIYYLFDENHEYYNYSGCGNTFNANHPVSSDMILDALKHWVFAYNIDGFRFDLASSLTRNERGIPMKEAHVLERIGKDPILSKKILIVEPWDAAGLYQTGSLHSLHQKGNSLFLEWNDRFRDDIRSFIKGEEGYSGRFASRMSGSQDLYSSSQSPQISLNFITSHDGFTLYDLVSYNTKHNLENGEDNRDGMNNNSSWNCGEEGESNDPLIIHLRMRQMQNFFISLLLSQGTPMIHSGDEYAHTKFGNNNSWCQDNDINWFSWSRLIENPLLSKFIRFLIDIRSQSHLFQRKNFLTSNDIQWHGTTPYKPNWEHSSQFVAYTLFDATQQKELYCAFNMHSYPISITIPGPSFQKEWNIYVNTSYPIEKSFSDALSSSKLLSNKIELIPYSTLILGTVEIV